jgi:hypothetical protein
MICTIDAAKRSKKERHHSQEQKKQRRAARKRNHEQRRRADEADPAEGGGGIGRDVGPAPSGGEDETPAWVRPIPDEAKLFGPDARHEPVYPDRPDSGHYYISLGHHTYFLKLSGLVGGQVPSELLTNDLGRIAGIRAWPTMRSFPALADPEEQARVVMNHVPGVRLIDAAAGSPDNIRSVLANLDPRSVADTLALEMITLAGDRHDQNYLVAGDCLVGIDYQTSFDPGWQRRYGVVARNLPDEMLETALNWEGLTAILTSRSEILHRVRCEVVPRMIEFTGSTADEVLQAVAARFAIIDELLRLKQPTPGDLIRLHPDRPGGIP